MGTMSSNIFIANQSMTREQAGGLVAKLQGAQLYYSPSASFLPLFSTQLCEGSVLGIQDARNLSSMLNVPVLVLSTYDGDILYVSYVNTDTNACYAHARVQYEEDIEQMLTEESPDVPVFLLELFPSVQQEQLVEIWESEEIDFSEDRLEELANLLQLDLPREQNDNITGYEKLSAK